MTPNPFIEDIMKDLQNRQCHETEEVRSKYAKEGFWLEVFVEATTIEEAMSRLRTESAGQTPDKHVFISLVKQGGLDRLPWRDQERQEAALSTERNPSSIPPMGGNGG